MEIIMADTFPTTLNGVSQTPNAALDLSVADAAAFAEFDRCMALTRAAIAAEACADAANQDPALAGCDQAAADAWAMADEALWRFHSDRSVTLWDVKYAAWVLLLMLEDDGDGLDTLTQRAQSLRYRAQRFARSPLPVELLSAPRMVVAADLVDEIIAAAQEDLTAREALRATPAVSTDLGLSSSRVDVQCEEIEDGLNVSPV
ncbi:hypothetical protein [Loktanella sp. DSM 29012]|uniref:hypothetical protein n=1 Tax=Loktanella sp. DSM 29012 TaxID=1881056 RepID=UPI000B7F8308|nr:hypothetical protein [Loktanella sp. DSM 29012]